MDVGAPSNFERLHELWGDAPPVPLRALRVDDDATLARMARTWREAGVLVCPHTAVGLEAAARDRAACGDDAPRLVLATAHPAKFPEVVACALPGVVARDEQLERLRDAQKRERPLAPTLAALRAALREALPG
jgi:threonine synthase